MQGTPVALGVAGGTGSGKTTVARAILDQVGRDRIAFLEQDSYYRDIDWTTETLNRNYETFSGTAKKDLAAIGVNSGSDIQRFLTLPPSGIRKLAEPGQVATDEFCPLEFAEFHWSSAHTSHSNLSRLLDYHRRYGANELTAKFAARDSAAFGTQLFIGQSGMIIASILRGNPGIKEILDAYVWLERVEPLAVSNPLFSWYEHKVNLKFRQLLTGDLAEILEGAPLLALKMVYQKAYHLFPDNPRITMYYGVMNVKTGDLDKGLALMQRAIAGEPGNMDFKFHYAGTLCAVEGSEEEAISVYQDILSLHPDLDMVKRALKDCRAKK